MGPNECWERLRSAPMGRIGITIGALPVILPIFYGVVGKSVVFRSSPGSKLAAATAEAVVAIEADEFSPETERGWSVVVQGIAREVTEADDLVRLRSLSLRAVSQTDDGERYVSVAAATITGRLLQHRPRS